MSAILVQICFFSIYHDKASKIGNKISETEDKDIRYMGEVSQSGRKTSQELRMLSRSLSDCKSLLLNVMFQVSQFVSNSQLCH